MKYFSKYYTGFFYTKYLYSLESKASIGFQAQHLDNSRYGNTWFRLTCTIHRPKRFENKDVKAVVNNLYLRLIGVDKGEFTWETEYKGPLAKAADSVSGTTSNYDTSNRSEKTVTLTFDVSEEQLNRLKKSEKIILKLTTGTEKIDYEFNNFKVLQIRAMCHSFLKEKLPNSLIKGLKIESKKFNRRRGLVFGIGYVLPFILMLYIGLIDDYLTDSFSEKYDYEEFFAIYILFSIVVTTASLLPFRKYLFK